MFNHSNNEIERYKIEAIQGDTLAQVSLGLMYHNGDDLPQDFAKAVE